MVYDVYGKEFKNKPSVLIESFETMDDAKKYLAILKVHYSHWQNFKIIGSGRKHDFTEKRILGKRY